jgi:hypothetical protein
VRRVALLLFLAVGFAGLGGGGWLVYSELARPATSAEIAAASRAEIASRWQRLTAGEIFPATIRYTTAPGITATAYRVGIAPSASCPAALGPQIAAVLDRRGCTRVLRATYTDASRVFMLTTGIAIMPSAAAASHAVTSFAASHPHGGIKPVPFPGTVANIPGTTGSDWFGAFHAGPYVLAFAAGATDGQSAQATGLNPAMVDLAFSVERPLAAQLAGQRRNPCQDQDIRC